MEGFGFAKCGHPSSSAFQYSHHHHHQCYARYNEGFLTALQISAHMKSEVLLELVDSLICVQVLKRRPLNPPHCISTGLWLSLNHPSCVLKVLCICSAMKFPCHKGTPPPNLSSCSWWPVASSVAQAKAGVSMWPESFPSSFTP